MRQNFTPQRIIHPRDLLQVILVEVPLQLFLVFLWRYRNSLFKSRKPQRGQGILVKPFVLIVFGKMLELFRKIPLVRNRKRMEFGQFSDCGRSVLPIYGLEPVFVLFILFVWLQDFLHNSSSRQVVSRRGGAGGCCKSGKHDVSKVNYLYVHARCSASQISVRFQWKLIISLPFIPLHIGLAQHVISFLTYPYHHLSHSPWNGPQVALIKTSGIYMDSDYYWVQN